jgi:arylsulfatase A-like enzyme
VLVQRMTSNSPWTLPAMSSLFTGRLPSALGMGGGPARLPVAVPTLATTLAGEGYLTRAFATNPWLKRDFGFHRGFSAFTHLEEGGVAGYQLKRMFWHRLLCGGPGEENPKDRIRADRVTSRALQWLEQVPVPGQPFFLWLHYMDPHEPYSPNPAPDAGPYRGRFLRSSGLVQAIMGGGLLETADLDRLQLLYDEEILAFDRQLGRLSPSCGPGACSSRRWWWSPPTTERSFSNTGDWATATHCTTNCCGCRCWYGFPGETPPGGRGKTACS